MRAKREHKSPAAIEICDSFPGRSSERFGVRRAAATASSKVSVTNYSLKATQLLGHPRAKMIEINGVAHLVLKVSNWEQCKPFYEQLLEFVGMTRVFSGQDGMYYVGGRTAVGVGPCDEEYKDRRFVQGTVGLHHVCFRARSRGDVDEIHRFCEAKTVTIVHPPEEGLLGTRLLLAPDRRPGGDQNSNSITFPAKVCWTA